MKQTLFILSVLFMFSCGGKEEHKDEKATSTNYTPNSAAILPVDSQVIFCLSMLSNVPASAYYPNYVFLDSVKAMKNIVAYSCPKIDSTIAKGDSVGVPALSTWRRVWGPAVTVRSSYMGSIAYVSSSSLTVFQDAANTGNYVVAIQATNPSSFYDWDVLDMNIVKTQPWTSVCSNAINSGNISLGTYTGLNSLFLLQSIINTKTTIMSFMDSLITSGKASNVVVTGHSLGGALSPVFALNLQYQVINNKSATKVWCMSTAGATPGDSTFANYYDSVLNGNTAKIWNYLDIVPRAWDTTLMYDVWAMNAGSGIYGAKGSCVAFDSIYKSPCSKNQTVRNTFPFYGMNTPADITSLVQGEISKAKSSGVVYKHICNGGYYFTGAAAGGLTYINVDTSGLSMLAMIMGTFTPAADTFMGQMASQHVAAYVLHYNIKPFHEYLKGLVDKDPYSMVNKDCNGSMPSKLPRLNMNRSEAMWRRVLMQAWDW